MEAHKRDNVTSINRALPDHFSILVNLAHAMERNATGYTVAVDEFEDIRFVFRKSNLV